MGKRVLCCYGIDLDAVAGWLNTTTGAPQDPTDLSRGVFGATVGTNRLLTLLPKYNIRATWFVPAHTAESFPSQIRKIVDAGHEIGLHGYTHEFVSDLSVEQQRDVLRKSIEVLRGFTGGERVKGWTAPAWKTGREVVGLLEEFGVEYDHSFMHHDSQPYYLPDPAQTHSIEPNVQNPASSWMKPMSALKPSSIVEIPANWHLDDWPPFQLSLSQPSTHGYVDTHVIERLWKEQFEYLYRECPEGESFVFPISIHPQVSGKPQVLLMHERLIEWINGHEGVEWVTFERVCSEFKEGKLEGVVVEGGV